MQRRSGWLRHNRFQCAAYNLGNNRLLYLLVSSAICSVYGILIACTTLTLSAVCKVDRNEALNVSIISQQIVSVTGLLGWTHVPFGGSGATENNEMQHLGLWLVVEITMATSSMCSSFCWFLFLSPPNPPPTSSFAYYLTVCTCFVLGPD